MMKKKLVAALMLFATTIVFSQSAAQARPHKRGYHAKQHTVHRAYAPARMARYKIRSYRHARGYAARATRQRFAGQSFGGRPSRWCGWWLGHHLGMPNRNLWLARNWASVGSNAGQPGVGVVVVWRNHVGIITGRSGSQWIVKSGNDGNAVRERPRSVAGAIAFRHVGGGGASAFYAGGGNSAI